MKSLKYVLVGGLLLLTACPGISQLLQSYGYTELKPPSTFFAPGTMVWVQHQAPFTAGIICTQATSLGPDFVPMQSPTEDAKISRAAQQSFELGAEYMSIVHGDVAFDMVQSITAQMQHPLIYTLNDVDIINNVPKRDPVCAQAIAGRREAGYKITMISNALMGDVTYTVRYKTNAKLDVTAKLAMLQNLALTLKLQNATVTENTISGKGLFWGVQDDTYLASLGDPNAVVATDADGNPRLIPADVSPNLVYEADAP